MKSSNDILKRLAGLSAADLHAVQQRAGLLLGNQARSFSAPTSSASIESVEETYQLVREFLRQRGDSPPPPWMVWSRKAPPASVRVFKEGSDTLNSFITRYLKVTRRSERLLASRILVRAVIAGMEERKFTRVKVDTIGSELRVLRDHVEAAFPGYIDSGWLPLIMKQAASRQRAGVAV